METNIDAVQPSSSDWKEAPRGLHGSETYVGRACTKAITEYGLRQQWRESTHLLAAMTSSFTAKFALQLGLAPRSQRKKVSPQTYSFLATGGRTDS